MQRAWPCEPTRRGTGVRCGSVAPRLGCAWLVALLIADASGAHAGVALVRRVETWSGEGLRIENPSGLAYLPSRGSFLIVDKDADDSPNFRGVNAWEVKLGGGGVLRGLDLTRFSGAPSDLACHPEGAVLFVTDDDALELYEVDLDGKRLGTIDLAALGAKDPEGVAYDAARDRLFVADGQGEQVLELSRAGRRVHSFSMEELGFESAEGIAYDARSDHLFVVSDDDLPLLLELTRDGGLAWAHGLHELGVVRPRGLALAPSSDRADAPDAQSLYVADELTKRHPDGRILELALVERPRGARALAQLVGDVDGFGFRSDAPGFAEGDLDHDGLLETGERLPAAPGGARFDNRDPEDPPATDAVHALTEATPLRFSHAVDLEGRPALWARLTLVAADARALPGARNLVYADGRLVGELVGTRDERIRVGAIERTVLELPPQSLRDLADGVLRVEIARPGGTGSDDLMLDYARLEVAVPR